MTSNRPGWSDAVRLSVGTLTALPTGVVGEIDAALARRAMTVAPLAVLPLALAAGVLAWVGHGLGLPSLVVGLLVVGLLALGTRALHLDGLADTVDGLGAGWNRDRSLAVMRSGDVGPMGVVALVLVLGLQAATFGLLGDGWRGALLVTVIVCVSRAALLLACRRGVPAARPDGLGAAVAGTVPTGTAVVGWAVGALAVAGALALADPRGWIGLLAAAAAVGAVLLVLGHCVRRFGGVTGDVMGAGVETALTVLLVVVAAR